MRRLSVLLLMVLMMIMLTLTRPRLASCRLLASPAKEHHANVIHGGISVKEQKDKPAEENKSSRVLIGGEVHTMASGPSRKGSGH